ncbi:serine hydrolase domain-containing protein [Pseudokineococcus sp. 1T1Z-3]|uniref:serine hydrolase domain-containing protein n=1 Tax=Pseudokineococcus sp. 1T1Z-3 TaxID=3132745 RepID=UPI0030A7DCC7
MTDTDSASTPAPTDRPRLREATTDRLLHLLAREQVDRRLPSVVAGLVRDGHLVWWGARGSAAEPGAAPVPPAPTTRYRIGSITKSLVATALMRAHDEGLLTLEDPVGTHLPELGSAREDVGALTVGQLLGQASGLQAENDGAGPWWERTPGGDWAALAPALTPDARRHRPGVRFHYSNTGFGVLGELLGRLRGRPWHDVVQIDVLDPLGMGRAGLRRDADSAPGLAVHPWADVVLPEPEHDAGAMAPAGQVWATVPDLARFAALLAGRDDAGVLSPQALALMRQLQVVDDPRSGAWGVGYGLGLQLWNVGGRRLVGHSGSMPGFVAMLQVDASTGDGVVAMTNSTTGFGDLATRLLDAMVDAEPPLPAPWTPRAPAPEVLELVGPWYWGPAPLVVRADGEGLLLEGLGRPARSARFRPAGDGTWVGLDAYYAGERLRVVRAADGGVSHLDLATFRLTRTPYDPGADVPGGVDEGGWRA